MRRPYETPKVSVVGSVKDLTQANLIGPQPDNFTVVSIVILGVPINVPGKGNFFS
jgi:hypothetical protein